MHIVGNEHGKKRWTTRLYRTELCLNNEEAAA